MPQLVDAMRDLNGRTQRAPLSVVIVNDFAHVNGGTAKVALDSACALVARGHQVTLLAAVAPVEPEIKQCGAGVVLTRQFDIKSDPIRLRAATQGVWNIQAAHALRRVLEQCDPGKTIVHFHGWTKALSSSVVRLAARYNFAAVVTLHDYFYACPNGGFFNFRKNEICHLRPLSRACVCENCDRDGYVQKLWRIGRQVIQDRYGFGSSQITNFITLSDLSETVLRQYLPVNARLYRIPNPINLRQSDPVEPERNVPFVVLGRLSSEKGMGLLARAAVAANCRVVFVGEGPERDTIQTLNPEAEITGWLSKPAVEEQLRRARALVLPSLWYEAQPLSVLEAAALGVPALVPDSSAARELVEDGVTGLWFRGGDAADLAQKLTMLRDDARVSRMGRNAYEKYWKNPPTLQRHAELLETCYSSVLEAHYGTVSTQ